MILEWKMIEELVMNEIQMMILKMSSISMNEMMGYDKKLLLMRTCDKKDRSGIIPMMMNERKSLMKMKHCQFPMRWMMKIQKKR